ncbi:hypothetical protein C8Q76DRAFT_690100 [Earliella scabrosa]|nr:hypothetical protein C8Q76DRAFT_690100 [Earliella scabrosa]
MSQAGSPGQRHSQDSDEFANLPDVVDFAAIPPMVASTGDSDERDEFAEYEHYNEADPFVGIDFDAIPELGVAPSLQVAVPPGQQTQSNDTAMTQGASDASSQYEFDELDASVWDEVDTIVRNAMAEPEAIPQTQVEPPAPTQAQHHVQPAPDTGSLSASRDVSVSIPQTQLSTRSSLKRARSNSSVNSNYSMYKKSKGKGKARADPHASVRKVLAGLEESLICSICFHIL